MLNRAISLLKTEDLKILKELKRGGFGTVSLAVLKGRGQKAVKEFNSNM